MSRLGERLEALRARKKTGLISYLVAGDPSKDATVALMHAMVEGGADVIELGVPFTDPVADGPVIQAACERSLRAGTRLADVFDIVRRFREQDAATPVVLMGYLNPLEALGYSAYSERAAESGADALLVVDLPAEETGDLSALLARDGLELVCLVAPTTSASRLAHVCRSVTGFVYYVSLKGVTGADQQDRTDMSGQIARIRSLTTRPVGIGFGIDDAETAALIAQNADAVIVGSALVRHIAEQGAAAGPAVTAALTEIRRALDRNTAAQTA